MFTYFCLTVLIKPFTFYGGFSHGLLINVTVIYNDISAVTQLVKLKFLYFRKMSPLFPKLK